MAQSKRPHRRKKDTLLVAFKVFHLLSKSRSYLLTYFRKECEQGMVTIVILYGHVFLKVKIFYESESLLER